VRITKKVSHYAIDGVRYGPGDIFEIPERLFKAHFMEKVVPPPPKPVVKVEPPETPEEPPETPKDEPKVTTKKTGSKD